MAAPLSHPVASRRCYRGDYAVHSHAHAQMLFGLSGTLDLDLAGRAARVEPGVALVMPPGTAHAYRALRPMQALVIDAPAQRSLERVRLLAFDARAASHAGELDPQALLDQLAGAPRVLSRRAFDLDALAAAVDAELHAAWPTARMAAWACLSVPRLHARLLERSGLSPQAWLRQRRLDRAQQLLRAGWLLETTAMQVGYASGSALAFALRRERGLGARRLRAGA